MELDLTIDGRFEIEQKIAAGGMGSVFRARDRLEDRLVAVKVLRERVGDRPRFDREAKLLAELSHPGIVRYVAHGKMPGGGAYLAMEWIEGPTLRQLLARDGVTMAEAVGLATQVADALGAVHQCGVVHRDVKPENILFEAGDLGRARLIDFGIASVLDTNHGLTRTGTLLGTLGFLAPEQARADRAVDARTDVFSLGCVLYLCITGRPAFAGRDLMAVQAKVLLQDPAPPRAIIPSIPAELDAVVQRFLAKDPGGRPEDGTAAAELLRSVRDLPDAARIRIVEDERPTRASPIGSAAAQTPAAAALILIGATEEQQPGDPNPDTSMRDAIADSVARCDARLDVLDGGGAIVAFDGPSPSADIEERAASCALGIHEHLPGAPLCLTLAADSGAAATGDLIDRGVATLDTVLLENHGGGVEIDAATAGLLEQRFELRRRGRNFQLGPRRRR